MTRTLLLLLLACAASVASAQPHLEAHAVPFGSHGNAVELTLVATGGSSDSLVVTAAQLPAWLRLTPAHTRVLPAQGETVARFAFDVDESAPVGDTAAVRFEITSGTGQRWMREVHLVVEAPQAFELDAAYPNPLRGTALVPFLVPEASRVRVVLYDVLGREVSVLADAEYAAGRHEARLDGQHLASGVYVVRAAMERGSGIEVVTRSVTLVK